MAVEPPTRPVPPSTRTRDEGGLMAPSLEMAVARDGLGRGMDAPAIFDGVLGSESWVGLSVISIEKGMTWREIQWDTWVNLCVEIGDSRIAWT